MNKIISVKNLSFFYNKKKIFKNLNFDIEEGSFTTIVGNNGSGKTTLVSILLGKLKYDGELVIDKKLETLNPNFRFINLNECLDKLFDNDFSKQEFIDEYNLKKILDIDYNSSNDSFKKFASFIKMLVNNPNIIILDNVLDEIEDKYKQKIIKILKKLNKKGITILNFSQNLDDALLGDFVLILDSGKIVLNGIKEEIFSDEKKLKELQLNLPFIIDLSTKLKYYRMVDKLYFNDEDLVDAIWK